ncbi:MAG: hypothetical protein IJY23_00420 [Clostridia bacterium]|nr:hypothetical protein [Clostridia bacterium]
MFSDYESRNSKLFYCAKGFLIFLAFFAISRLTSLITMLQALPVREDPSPIYGALPTFVVYLVSFAAAIFIFNSVSLAFAVFDKDELHNFLMREEKEIHFFREVSDILKTPHLLFEIITSLVCCAIAALLGGFYEVGGIFFESAHRSGWFPTVIMLPLCFIPAVLSKYEARRYWYKLERENTLDKVTKPIRFFLRLSLIFVLYPTLFPLSPLLAGAIYSIFAIIFTLFGALTVVGIVVILALIPILFFVIPYLRFIKRRKRFFKKMNKIAMSEGYDVRDVKNQYNYFMNSGKCCTFDLALEETTYNCLVISTSKRSVPLIFTSPTSAYFEHKLGTDDHHISVNRNIDFFLHGDGIKIIVVLPSPKHVYVTDGIKRKRISQADKIWDYTVHDDVSFLGAMDRKSLHRNTYGEYH